MANRSAGVQTQDTSERYEKLYTMLLDAIPSSVLMVDRDLSIVSANRNFLEKSRRSISNTIGFSLEEVFPAIILNNINITHQIREVFESNEPTGGQRMSFRAPGVPMTIYYYRILPFSWKGIVENVVLLMDDVTEQIRLSEEVRRVERHLASVFESASDMILSTDIESKISSWNPAAERISGYHFHEVKDHSLFGYFAKHHQDQMKQVFQSMKNGEESREAEWDLITKGGDDVHVSWVCSPMKDRKSQAMGVVAVGRDLTERRKLEIQLLQSQKFAALGVMAGGIAHEIRNPLAICSSAAQFLMDDDIDQEFRKECADKIHTGIQRASIIIENLLRFARPSVKSDMEPLDLSALVKETLTLIANQAKIQKIEVSTSFTRKPTKINGNASLLQQVFINLLLNGIQAMPKGGALSIAVTRKNHNVLIRVADTGEGISGRDLVKIFDPFYTTSSVGKGTGLGLSICYSIIEQHAGVIEVDSAKGKGSTFIVKLPVL